MPPRPPPPPPSRFSNRMKAKRAAALAVDPTDELALAAVPDPVPEVAPAAASLPVEEEVASPPAQVLRPNDDAGLLNDMDELSPIPKSTPIRKAGRRSRHGLSPGAPSRKSARIVAPTIRVIVPLKEAQNRVKDYWNDEDEGRFLLYSACFVFWVTPIIYC